MMMSGELTDPNSCSKKSAFGSDPLRSEGLALLIFHEQTRILMFRNLQ